MSSKSAKPLYKLFDHSDKIPNFEIDDSMHEALCFRERLIINLKEDSSVTKPVGGYCISIESIGAQRTEFMIRVSSSLNVNDSYAGSKVLGSTTSKFQCLEEKRTEYMHCEDGRYEKILYAGLEDDIYHLEIKDSCPCNESKWQKNLPSCLHGKIISEGANVLLMRYLATKNFHGSLSFQSIMIGGQLTTCNYRCTEAQSITFGNREVEVYTIERRIHEECGLVHNIKTFMTKSGFILRHDWLGIPYFLEIDPLINPNEMDCNKSKFSAPLRSKWSSDIQMLSLYQDKKTYKMAQQAEYLADHTEIKQLISDYARTLLAGNHLATKSSFLAGFFREPDNVLSFTIQHFAAFAMNSDLLNIGDTNQSNLDIMSQLSQHKSRRVCSVCGICLDCLMLEKYPKFSSESNNPSESLASSPSEPESATLSPCSVLSKCSSNAACVRKSSKNRSIAASCSDDCKACKSDKKINNSLCSFYSVCENICDGCRPIRELCTVHKACPQCPGCYKVHKEPCAVHKACPECAGCHKVCSEIAVCPSCKKCNIEIFPDAQSNGCKRDGAGTERNCLNLLDK